MRTRVHEGRAEEDYDIELREDIVPADPHLTEEGLKALLASKLSWRDEAYAHETVEIGKHIRLFGTGNES